MARPLWRPHSPPKKQALKLDFGINSDIVLFMGQIENILEQLKENPANVRFADLCKVCDHYFGKARQSGGSHNIYKTPWQGDPRVNIQNNKGKAKEYQVKQVIKAIERMEVENAIKK